MTEPTQYNFLRGAFSDSVYEVGTSERTVRGLPPVLCGTDMMIISAFRSGTVDFFHFVSKFVYEYIILKKKKKVNKRSLSYFYVKSNEVDYNYLPINTHYYCCKTINF